MFLSAFRTYVEIVKITSHIPRITGPSHNRAIIRAKHVPGHENRKSIFADDWFSAPCVFSEKESGDGSDFFECFFVD